ncbi:cyclic nucleotide-binding domain-containing protein [Candidatus Woesearchaeota archaeon]|jgi:hypothetical protein|nr:cyclic nucleotide-binding domain-containing protein [Candidatus Woesearchaeota archaeon]MBT5272631.1 cyclic nucleotide-binding domain-containing protein [Candidatus Woesearchaeota archaeon]MBT6041732.1 cyclic nucleotide-binding domain-containing protein [Candidatus Woesearchaeota archaeon]MBT6337183.1 cyclic nucleotide-binding domain-containing protein [Candidatus Woesearchaeota archaeon]MBT7928179.1 cyclic nucleotide-binding domain-containing protein [Candidatus Woesearchaeota archaeon]
MGKVIQLSENGSLSDLVLEKLTQYTRVGDLPSLTFRLEEVLDDSRLIEEYLLLKQEYQSFPKLLRGINAEHSELLELIEKGTISRNIVSKAWLLSDQTVEHEKEFTDEPTQEELKGALEEIAEMLFAHSTTFEPRQRIFRQGDPGEAIYIIEKGEVDVILEERSGNKKIATLGSGNIFGEMAIIDGNVRSASLYAKDEVKVNYVSSEEFQDMIYDETNLPRAMALMTYVVNIMRSRVKFIDNTNGFLRWAAEQVEKGNSIERIELSLGRHTYAHLQAHESGIFNFKVPFEDKKVTSVGKIMNSLEYAVGDATTLMTAAIHANESGPGHTRFTRKPFANRMENLRTAYESLVKADMCYKIDPQLFEILDFQTEDYAKLRDRMMNKGLLAGMLYFGKWNPEHIYRNRKFLTDIMEKAESSSEHYLTLGDMILAQHPTRKITKVDCELAIQLYYKAIEQEAALNNETGIKLGQNKIEAVKAYAKEKQIKLSQDTETDHKFVDLNVYQATPGINEIVNQTFAGIIVKGFRTTMAQVAVDFQKACALEPLFNKEGCTTRYWDLSQFQKLDQFVVAGVNMGPAIFELLSRVENYQKKHGKTCEEGQDIKQPGLLYDACYNMQVLSKLNRRGGRLNQGIIEFGFPLIATMAICDPYCEKPVDFLFDKATELLQNTTEEDVSSLINMKQFAYILSRVERNVGMHPVTNVFDYYAAELKDAEDSKNLNSIVHNRQFVQGFPDIRKVYDVIQNTSGDLNQRVVAAYNQVFEQPHYQEMGKGLAADFIAVGLFLAFSYNKNEEIVW